jgi:nitroimidazol reductase NimA-like FMN-containing flavoprotein (pyridoxamine 5'-phosphate oxidase superfamily)
VPDGSGPVGSPASDRTRLRRLADQGSYRSEDLHAVLDAGFVCHLGVVVAGGPMVVPTSYGRAGDHLYLHGSVASRSLRAAKEPASVCVTVTLVDGVVLARSVFNHSVNYRCAMVYGLPEALTDDEKLAGLRIISDHVAPGQWEYARSPSAKELAATTVLRLSLDEASVKVSEGPPDDGDGPDGALDVWAGEIPLRTVRLDPVADPALRAGIMVPDHLREGRAAPGATPWRALGRG